MNYRNAVLLAATDVGPAGTKEIPIRVKQPISRINIYWKVTASKHGMDSYCHRDMVKIELVDGSEVLHSLNGGQNQALCIYDRKVPTMIHGQFASGDSLASSYGIDFGRFLHDPLLALDPSRFDNLQLKITHNEALADTGASVNELRVWADIFDEKVISPMGFLMAKEHFSYTLSGTGYEYVDLPRDHILRKLLVQGYLSAFEPWYTIGEARLDEDNEKRIPFDWDIEIYHRLKKGMWLPVEDLIEGLTGAATKTYYGTPTDYWAACKAGTRNHAITANIGTPSRGGKFTVTHASGSGGFIGSYRGWLPNHCVEFPFGDPKDLEDWYDVTKLGSLRLRLKGGSGGAGGGTGAVVLQQLRKY
ncbi:hypothetical protein LCGC14_0848670 [marine sediment metagenome]|uniref:Uncharacterized protein n=1 Tax=marine sediment metagenome TaxID=412755 RepID=A0A0F9RVS9_9ZZZZ